MRIRENLGGFLATQGRNITIPPTKPQIGKVFGVITTKDTPTKELFEKNGGWSGIGTIFYLDYEQSKNIDNADLSKCKIAKPFHASTQNYPLIGELVQLVDGPAALSQINNTTFQKYYTGVINLWNNNQQNAPSGDSLGKTFSENADIRGLISFEGDRIYQGRNGNGIRFGSTVSSYSNINEWSSVGNNGDPITILVNGYVTTDKTDVTPNVEEINKELSSIYLTSSQKLPLQPDKKDILNPITKPLLPEKYTSSQIILNSDRITLNSRKDEVMVFAKTNVELNTKNTINLNADNHIHLNSPNIALGTNSDGSLPTEPILLGGKTHDLLLNLCTALQNLASYLTSATSTEAGSLIPSVNDAGTQLFNDINSLISDLENIQSTKNFTV